jgi:transcription elongation factor GreA
VRYELDRLRGQRDVEFAARLREARDFGEVNGNDDYWQVREEEAVLASRIASLASLLDQATVVAEPDRNGDRVAVSSSVQVEDLEADTVQELRIIGDFERVAPNAVSASSPVGQALIGRAVGDEVEVELPNSRTRTLEVIAVR